MTQKRQNGGAWYTYKVRYEEEDVLFRFCRCGSLSHAVDVAVAVRLPVASRHGCYMRSYAITKNSMLSIKRDREERNGILECGLRELGMEVRKKCLFRGLKVSALTAIFSGGRVRKIR